MSEGMAMTEIPQDPQEPVKERYEFNGGDLFGFLENIVREGRIRRIVVKNEKGRTLLDMPMGVGLIGAFLLPPVWIAVATVAALATSCSIEVERDATEAAKSD